MSEVPGDLLHEFDLARFSGEIDCVARRSDAHTAHGLRGLFQWLNSAADEAKISALSR
jgi:hypothetical protein